MKPYVISTHASGFGFFFILVDCPLVEGITYCINMEQGPSYIPLFISPLTKLTGL